MKKTTYSQVDLNCVLQQGDEITTDQCLNGIISRTEKGFRFEETIRKGRPPRNQKLYDGDYISMVRMQNGRYQCHLKTMKDGFDKEKFAFAVYCELTKAMLILD